MKQENSAISCANWKRPASYGLVCLIGVIVIIAAGAYEFSSPPAQQIIAGQNCIFGILSPIQPDENQTNAQRIGFKIDSSHEQSCKHLSNNCYELNTAFQKANTSSYCEYKNQERSCLCVMER